jgi:hypothetical protein
VRTSLADSRAVAEGFAAFLEGPGRYLVLAANNAEMRAGSGMWLSAGVLTVEQGRFELGEMRPTGDMIVPTGAVPVSGDFAARWGWLDPTHDFRNLATTPRFEVTAPLAADMWRTLTGETVDGVLVLDPLTLQALLAAEGPVALDDGTMLDADNVLEFVFIDQYREAPELDADQQARRDRLGTIARAAVDAFEQREWKPPRLVDELTPAGQGRHALAWSRDPVEQRAWETAGIAGALEPESVLISLMNTGGNKLDQYMLVDARLRSDERGAQRDVRIRVRVRNNTPEGPPPYVVGPFPGLGLDAGDYLGILTVNVPGSARGSSIEGVESLVAAGADGPTRVVAATVRVNRGETVETTVKFTMPARVAEVRIEPSAREPGILWRFGDKEWQDRASRHIQW